ncbi:MAG: hypothetical protein AAFX54_03795 [Pseudomonadota bacterium]
MEAIDLNRRVRLYVRMDCSEAEGVIAAEFFTVFEQIIAKRFMGAAITARQYDRARHRERIGHDETVHYAAFDGRPGAPFVAAHDGEYVLCFRDEDAKLEAADVSEEFARIWIEEFAPG